VKGDKMTIRLPPLHDETLPILTTSQKVDVTTIYFCMTHNGCLIRADVFINKDNIICCRKHGTPVSDVTNAPLGRAFRDMVHPYPKE